MSQDINELHDDQWLSQSDLVCICAQKSPVVTKLRLRNPVLSHLETDLK